MSDYTRPPCSTVIAGMTGSGKTTFAISYLLNVKAAARFVFDDLGQVAARLKIPHASTAYELESALSTRWVVFNPHRMFPGKIVEAFNFFCQWSLDASRRGPGKKVILVDEAWRFQNGHAISPEFAALAQMARVEELELVTCTQVPNRLNGSIIGSATEAIIFKLTESNALETVESEYQIDGDTVRNLPLGHYIAKNRMNGCTITGKMW